MNTDYREIMTTINESLPIVILYDIDLHVHDVCGYVLSRDEALRRDYIDMLNRIRRHLLNHYNTVISLKTNSDNWRGVRSSGYFSGEPNNKNKSRSCKILYVHRGMKTSTITKRLREAIDHDNRELTRIGS